nr:hypothetical protein [Tanacetum cinerariifolium]
NRQKSEGSFPLPLGSDADIADAAIATSDIDDDDDTALMDTQPHEPRRSPRDTQTMPPRKSTRGNLPPLLTQDTVNRMIQESVEVTIRAERERVQNEANRAEGANVAPVARECLIRWIKKKKMVFTVSKCTEANKVVFAAATFQDQALTWWNSQVEAYIRGLSKNIKGEVTSSEPATLNKAVRMAYTLMEQKVKAISEREADNKKRKWENFQGGSSGGGNNNSNQNNNNYNSNRNYNNIRNNNQNQYRNPNRNHQNNPRQGNARAMTNNVKCNRCGMQHYGNCPIKCNKCGKIKHKARDCWSKVVATGANAQPVVTCYGCGEKGHI